MELLNNNSDSDNTIENENEISVTSESSINLSNLSEFKRIPLSDLLDMVSLLIENQKVKFNLHKDILFLKINAFPQISNNRCKNLIPEVRILNSDVDDFTLIKFNVENKLLVISLSTLIKNTNNNCIFTKFIKYTQNLYFKELNSISNTIVKDKDNEKSANSNKIKIKELNDMYYDLNKNIYFIDWKYDKFKSIISLLRYRQHKIKDQLSKDINFWKISYNKIFFNSFDKNWCAETLIYRNEKLIEKNGSSHGLVFLSHPLSFQNRCVEFQINIKSNSNNNNSNMFIGCVDKSYYKKEYLTSSLWKESPCSFYWDVAGNKLVMTDENGKNRGSLSNYGCNCECNNSIRIKIDYNPNDNSLSFYKNSICQGKAFTNLKENIHLYPSLDLWFQIGSVSIIDKDDYSFIS